VAAGQEKVGEVAEGSVVLGVHLPEAPPPTRQRGNHPNISERQSGQRQPPQHFRGTPGRGNPPHYFSGKLGRGNHPNISEANLVHLSEAPPPNILEVPQHFRGTPTFQWQTWQRQPHATLVKPTRPTCMLLHTCVRGYLAHKNVPAPLGPPWGPSGYTSRANP